MTKKERVQAVLQGRRPDRPPVSFWHHFRPDQITGTPARDAHLRFVDTYDLDFVKVMNDHRFPRGGVELLQSVGDLRRIKALPGDAGDFAGQLELLRQLRQSLGSDILMCTTLFNPWAVLRQWTRPPSDTHNPPKLNGEDDRDQTLTRFLQEDRSAVKAAIETVGKTLAGFARACIAAGANGVFLSVRDDWVDSHANGAGTYDALIRETDLRVLGSVREASFNLLHICGRALNFKRFAEYPVAVLNWADRAAGPSIAYARDRVKPAMAGGVDNLKTLPEGTPEDCANEVRDALRQAKDRPIMISAGCTFDPVAVPGENLHAVVTAARNE